MDMPNPNAVTWLQCGIKSHFLRPGFALALAVIRRLVLQSKAIGKDDLLLDEYR